LKKMQVEAGMIPKSCLQRLDWMYQDRNAAQQDNQDSEAFLLGKPVQQTDTKETNQATEQRF